MKRRPKRLSRRTDGSAQVIVSVSIREVSSSEFDCRPGLLADFILILVTKTA